MSQNRTEGWRFDCEYLEYHGLEIARLARRLEQAGDLDAVVYLGKIRDNLEAIKDLSDGLASIFPEDPTGPV